MKTNKLRGSIILPSTPQAWWPGSPDTYRGTLSLVFRLVAVACCGLTVGTYSVEPTTIHATTTLVSTLRAARYPAARASQSQAPTWPKTVTGQRGSPGSALEPAPKTTITPLVSNASVAVGSGPERE